LIVGGYTSESSSTFTPNSPTVADFNVALVGSKNFAGALLYNLDASANPSVLSGAITSSLWGFIGAAFKSVTPTPSTGNRRWFTGDGVHHGRSSRFRHRQHQ
jgi:hypothetical protein